MNKQQAKRRKPNLLRYLDKKNIMKCRLRKRRDFGARQKKAIISELSRTKARIVREKKGIKPAKKEVNEKKVAKLSTKETKDSQEQSNFAVKSEQFICEPKTLGYSFFQQFRSQIIQNIRQGEIKVLKHIATESTNISKIISGEMEPNIQILNEAQDMRIEAPIPYFKPLSPSQWVFLTPDKQRLKNMEELNFTSSLPTSLQPAVFQKSSSSKTIYTVNENIRKTINMRGIDDDQVPIDLAYLKPEYKSKAVAEKSGSFDEDSNEVNNFLVSTEDTIDFGKTDSPSMNPGELSRKRPHLDSHEEEYNWYEKQMKLLATSKPSKPSTKKLRASSSLRKTLSFQDETPTKVEYMRPRCKSYAGDNDSSFSESEFNNGLFESHGDNNTTMEYSDPMNQEQSFSNLSHILDNVNINNIDEIDEIPPPKMYPRKICD